MAFVTRRAPGVTVILAADALNAHGCRTDLGVCPALIGELELGRRPNEKLVDGYRRWLKAA